MCGVVGVSATPGAEVDAEARAHALVRELRHRGPDGCGVTGDRDSAIAMSRLRVRSLMTDKIPFRGNDDEFKYAYNGEIYSCRRGREQVVPAGGYEEARAAGDDGRHVDGMYAVVVRRADGSLVAARDHLGIKPLYVQVSRQGVVFASELPALVSTLGCRAPRWDAIAQFLLVGRVVDGGTFYEDVVEVRPGERITAAGGRITSSVIDAVPAPARSTPTAHCLRRAIAESVRAVLPSDRGLGLALSGGLDSTVVAAELASAGVEGVRTVSVIVRDTADGLRALEDLNLPGDSWRTWEHRSVDFAPSDLLERIGPVVQVLGEPTLLTSSPMYGMLADLAADSGIVVLLLGEGADELFGGYDSYRGISSSSTLADFYISPRREQLVEALVGAAAVASAREGLLAAAGGGSGSLLDSVRAFEIEHSLGPLLRRADHLLMSRGIEGRTPFLHASLPDIAGALTSSQFIGEARTKPLLRDAYAATLEPATRARKVPFRAPLSLWLAGPLCARASRYLQARAELLVAAGINPSGISHVLDELGGGDGEIVRACFGLIALGEWLSWLEGLAPAVV